MLLDIRKIQDTIFYSPYLEKFHVLAIGPLLYRSHTSRVLLRPEVKPQKASYYVLGCLDGVSQCQFQDEGSSDASQSPFPRTVILA